MLYFSRLLFVMGVIRKNIGCYIRSIKFFFQQSLIINSTLNIGGVQLKKKGKKLCSKILSGFFSLLHSVLIHVFFVGWCEVFGFGVMKLN